MLRRGVLLLMGNYLQGRSVYVCVCVHMVSAWVGVSTNLHCMHIFEIDHMFICARLKEQYVPAAYL